MILFSAFIRKIQRGYMNLKYLRYHVSLSNLNIHISLTKPLVNTTMYECYKIQLKLLINLFSLYF